MARIPTAILAGIALLLALAPLAPGGGAQKSGGVLKIQFFDSPASMSIHEESTIAGQGPMMGVFNNLVMYDQSVPQSGLKSVVPDLASEWSWDESRHQPDLQAAPGRQVARRQAVHRAATSNAPGICCRARQPRSCASIRARPGTRNLDEVVANGD